MGAPPLRTVFSGYLPLVSRTDIVRGRTNSLGRNILCSRRTSSTSGGLPAPTDLLDRYRGLVSLGRIQWDDEQVRVIMQLRKLHRELLGYAPPATVVQHLSQRLATRSPSLEGSPAEDSLRPWWIPSPETTDSLPTVGGGLVRVRTHAEEIEALTTPKGLLLTGPPGCGKSFLLDLWLAMLPTPFKARKHYSELVLEIYRAVWEETRLRMASAHASPNDGPIQPWNTVVRERWRSMVRSGSLPIRWRRNSAMSFSLPSSSSEPTIAYVVAQRLILRHWLLVFDEIQLLDVSSATLLADVLSWFWRMGGVIVGTSNKVPDDLYKNGVQRDRLEPFVEALKARCPVVSMRATQDWREVRGSTGERTWYTLDQKAAFDARLAELVSAEQCEVPREAVIAVFQRPLRVPWASGGICRFSFSELCDESLGAADYISLASKYHTVAITSIPVLQLSAKNQARRFISLIDALYEARCRLLCLAEAPPEALFFPDGPGQAATDKDVDTMMAESVAETQDVYRPNVSSYAAPQMAREKTPSKALALDKLSFFSGEDEQFAFKRALSRLLEMTSESYASEERWTPLPSSERPWEQTTAPTLLSSISVRSPRSVDSPLVSYDFAEEASVRHQPLADRPPAPRLDESHIWGVRDDWGARASRWGQGARAYEEDQAVAGTSSKSNDQTPREE